MLCKVYPSSGDTFEHNRNCTLIIAMLLAFVVKLSAILVMLLLLMSDMSLFYTVISKMSVKINYTFLNLVWHSNSFLGGMLQKQEDIPHHKCIGALEW